MPRLALPEASTLTGRRKAQYERFPSNLTRALLLLDQRLGEQLPQMANALRSSPLNPAWREGVILRVAALQHSEYERFQHLDQARRCGWTPTQIEAIERDPDNGSLPGNFRTVLHFVDDVVAGPTVSDTTFDAARNVLDDQDLVTVIVLVGHYMTVARILGTLQVPLDEQPDTWASEH